MQLINAPNPIQETASGVISIRCEDYVGPARGTLTTVTDSISVAGTVVKDTQTIALATSAVSFSTRWALASDTLRIPIADILSFYDTSAAGLAMLLGLKVLGTGPIDATRGSSFYAYDVDASTPSVSFGRDSTYFGSRAIQKSVWGNQYRIIEPLNISESNFLTGVTNLTIRAWGITGGSQEFYLDVLYLIPFGGLWNGVYSPSIFTPLELFQNGEVYQDQDNNASSNVLGKFSVQESGSKSGWPSFVGSPVDYQSANDEPTVFDANQQGLWDGVSGSPPLLDPSSYLMVICATNHLPAQTIISEPFNDTITPGFGVYGTTPQGYSKFYGGANTTGGASGWRENSGYAECFIRGGQTGNFWPHSEMAFGTKSDVLGSLPHQARPILTDLEDCVITFSFSITGSAHIKFLAGICDDPNPGGPGFNFALSGLLVDNASGALTVSLQSLDSRSVSSITSFGGDQFRRNFGSPSSVQITASYTPGNIYWVKVERRRYYWRAKCWADGTSEPSSWAVTGHGSYAKRNTAGTVIGWLDYPYDDNWASSVDNDTIFSNSGPLRNRGIPSICAEEGSQSTADNFLRIHQYDLTVDPVGSSPGDMHIAEVKYDFSAQWDEITVPAGSWRIVDAGFRKRHFLADTHGFNINAWKSSGAPELQYSLIPAMYELVVDAKNVSFHTYASLK